jgi:hypothetical protein
MIVARSCSLTAAAWAWAPWLNWVLEGWHSKQLALALVATTLGDRFTDLAISVLYRGCAVPMAWIILKANERHAWSPEWKTLGRLARIGSRGLSSFGGTGSA